MSPASPTSSGGRRSDDPQLIPFLDAASDDAAGVALETLLAGEVDSVIRGVVRRELTASAAGAGQLQDVLADVRMRLVGKLWKRRRDEPSGAAVDNIQAYAAVVAENACHSFVRAQFPERSRLRNRISYAAGHHPGTAIERDGSGVLRCHSRAPVRSAPAAGSTVRFIDDPAGWMSRAGIDPRGPLPAVINALLATFDRPIELGRLVDALALVLGIVDTPGLSRRTEAPADIVDPLPHVSDVIEQRESLAAVWAEIVALPPRQRAALILNLRDPDGGGAVLPLLPDTGVASMAGIAEAAGISVEELVQVWDQLPLDDFAIAAKLGLTRQQVINLRKAARARLARRLHISARK